MSDISSLWLVGSYQPQRRQWVDRAVPIIVGNRRRVTSVPDEPEKIPHPIDPQNDAADTTHLKLSDPSNFEDFNFAERLGYFKSSLLDYGRSIIESTVNEEPDSQNAENDIIAANEKVIAQYTSMFQTLKELSDKLATRDVEVSDLRDGIEGLNRAKAAMMEENSDIIQTMVAEHTMTKNKAAEYCGEKERYQKLLVEAEKGRREAKAELDGIRQDNKRKRDRMQQMWGNVEREVKQ